MKKRDSDSKAFQGGILGNSVRRDVVKDEHIDGALSSYEGEAIPEVVKTKFLHLPGSANPKVFAW